MYYPEMHFNSDSPVQPVTPPVLIISARDRQHYSAPRHLQNQFLVHVIFFFR